MTCEYRCQSFIRYSHQLTSHLDDGATVILDVWRPESFLGFVRGVDDQAHLFHST